MQKSLNCRKTWQSAACHLTVICWYLTTLVNHSLISATIDCVVTTDFLKPRESRFNKKFVTLIRSSGYLESSLRYIKKYIFLLNNLSCKNVTIKVYEVRSKELIDNNLLLEILYVTCKTWWLAFNFQISDSENPQGRLFKQSLDGV